MHKIDLMFFNRSSDCIFFRVLIATFDLSVCISLTKVPGTADSEVSEHIVPCFVCDKMAVIPQIFSEKMPQLGLAVHLNSLYMS